MTKNLANDRQAFAIIKRMRKANKLAKCLARGGFGEEAQNQYLMKYPEAINKK
jgi:hypothetical protein